MRERERERAREGEREGEREREKERERETDGVSVDRARTAHFPRWATNGCSARF